MGRWLFAATVIQAQFLFIGSNTHAQAESANSSIDAAQQQLAFLAATQERTQLAYSELSFDATLTTTNFVTELNKPYTVSSVFQVRTQSGATLVTWECYDSLIRDDIGGGRFKVEASTKPVVIRCLKTKDYIAYWKMVDTPEIQIHLLTDWKADLKGYAHSYSLTMGPADIQQLCFGFSVPFHVLYANRNAQEKWRLVEFDPSGHAKVEREVADRENVYKTDLRLSFSTRDGVLTDAQFRPINSKAKESIRRIEYGDFMVDSKPIKVPVRYVRHSGAELSPKAFEASTMEFSNYMNKSREPVFDLSDMEAPEGAIVYRNFPDGHTEYISLEYLDQLTRVTNN